MCDKIEHDNSGTLHQVRVKGPGSLRLTTIGFRLTSANAYLNKVLWLQNVPQIPTTLMLMFTFLHLFSIMILYAGMAIQCGNISFR